MKNIITILKEAGLTLTDEQEQAINKAAAENYRTIADYQKVQAARDGLQTQLDGVKADLAKFDGVDLDGLKKQITDAQRKAADAEAAYTKQLADRDYNDAVKSFTAGLKFSSKSAERAFSAALKDKGLKLEDGKLLGAEDFVTEYKKEDAGAFVTEQEKPKAHFTAPAGQTGSADDVDADFLKMIRKAAGLTD